MTKKPENKEWDALVEGWHKSDHDGKLVLAEKHGVAYSTMRHWISDNGAAKKVESSLRPFRMSETDILTMDTGVNLDFVSFDLETSNLTADFSLILSAVIKPFGKEPIVFRADSYPTWDKERENDGYIVRAISDEIRKHAIVITHYGMYFDIPYFQAKLRYHGLPVLPSMFAIDSWKIAYKNFKVSSRKLSKLVEYFDIGEKEEVAGGVWMKAAYGGSKEAMDKIVSHNIKDCILLEKLASLTFPFVKSIPRL